jgi:hypothetical protein
MFPETDLCLVKVGVGGGDKVVKTVDGGCGSKKVK